MRVMIDSCVYEICKAYKEIDQYDERLKLVLITGAGKKISFPMSDGDIDFALNQLYKEGKLIGNWKIT